MGMGVGARVIGNGVVMAAVVMRKQSVRNDMKKGIAKQTAHSEAQQNFQSTVTQHTLPVFARTYLGDRKQHN